MKLNELTKEEWRDIVREAKPGLSDEEYEQMWARFQAAKQRKQLQ